MSLIQVSNLTFGYEGSFDNVFENASFSIDTNWRCGFIGRNGRGKTTFLNLLLGKYAYSGTISASVNFEYFPFEVENPDDTPLEIAESIVPDFEMWRLTRELNLLDADPGLLYRPYSTLSYGERTKVLLSILFIRENSFLLIDEPTNHLDIEARGTLAQYLKSKKGFILVSHDRAFLDEKQVQMTLAREFYLAVRLKNEKPDTAYTLLSTIETKFRDNGFTTRRAGKEDLKRLLAIYFEQNTTTERFEDYDGQRFLEVV